MEWSDPIEEFIGSQLRSISNSDLLRPIKTRSKKVLGIWPYAYHKESKSMRNTHEDQLLDALDNKYKRVKRRQDRVMDLLSKNYTQKEIASLIGVHYSTVKRDMSKIRRRFRLWKKSLE